MRSTIIKLLGCGKPSIFWEILIGLEIFQGYGKMKNWYFYFGAWLGLMDIVKSQAF